MLKKIIPYLFIVFLSHTTVFAHKKEPYLILISIDGFRHDYAENFDLQFLKSLQKKSKFSHKLYPVYPSKTFPNHLSLITGEYPDNHGIIGNSFYDKKRKIEYHIAHSEVKKNPIWYKKEPIWIPLERKGIKTASYFWPSSDVRISGLKPTYSKPYDGSTPNQKRLQQALDWLKLPEEKSPHFITLYLSTVDTAGHKYGPESRQTREASLKVDKALKQFLAKAKKIKPELNFMICSDHGMTQIKAEKVLYLSELMQTEKVHHISGSGTLIHLYLKNKKEVKDFYTSIKKVPGLEIFLKKDIPEKLNLKNSEYAGDIIVKAKYPHYILRNKDLLVTAKADHGYDPNEVKDMIGIYYEDGPNFKGKARDIRETKDVYHRIKQIFNL